ncbi:hypothetical protein OF829_02125 [Sphingomonas sp. LB-2]|uniref:hypothetical protein n=1 Tax=Sphingomonas caeni TaxID=2984949 RepID=UPI0022311F75|nr:hypothetical protein [Sphingomonas caeni]MCW3846018.1 hypothetical protein [Sphingomonas caeni]
MRIRSPHRHLKKGLTHPNRLVAAATWLLVLLLGWVLVRLVMALVDDFWLLVIVWSQPWR